MNKISKITLAATLLTGSLCLAADEQQKDTTKRLAAANQVMTETMAADDKGVPQDLLKKAKCIIIVPGLKKVGFIFGGQYGKGFATCRTDTGFTSPASIRIEGGSVGFQIGASETDLVLLVMNDVGMKNLLKSKFQLGGEATAAAGPVGRDVSARTDAMMRAQILTYSRARGLFAGVSLQGSTLRQDSDDNRDLYGKSLTNTQILTGKAKHPTVGTEFIATVSKYAL